MAEQKRTKEPETHGLTQSQLSIWTGQLLNPGAPLYNMVYTFDLRGEIDTRHFRRAFRELTARSDALRLVLTGPENDPRQMVRSEPAGRLEILDLTGRSFTEDDLGKWIAERSRRIFDLQKQTFDSVLLRLAVDRFVWFFNQHHLTTDARSSSLLYKKMAALYAASIRQETAGVPAFPSYLNYVKFEKEVRQTTGRETLERYWRETAAAFRPPSGLYGETNAGDETLSERIVIDLGKERSRALRRLTAEQDLRAFTADLALFNIFAAVLLVYLKRIGGRPAPVFGTPVHNRTSPEFRETPGLFIEFFPFSVGVRPDDTFISLFERVSRKTFEFLKNARSGASTPATNRGFDVVLNYINTDFPAFEGIPCKAVWRHPGHADAAHHLRLHVYNDAAADSIELYFDLNLGVFADPGRRAAVPRHFLRLLDAFIDDRRQKIGRPPLAGREEIREPAAGSAGPDKPGESKNVLELFQDQVRQNGETAAVVEGTRGISYTELDQNAGRLAAHLAALGIGRGDRVALHLTRSADLITAILGVLRAGGVYVPIAAGNPPARVAEKIEVSASRLVLTHRNLEKNLKDAPVPVVHLEEERREIAGRDPVGSGRKTEPDDLAYLMFTSGSTGVPKGVKISHRALANYISAAGKKYAGDKKLRFPLFTTIDFDLTVTSVFMPLATGGTIVVYEEEEKDAPDLALLDVVEDNTADIIKLTPAHLALIKNRDLSGLKIKTMIVGGEDLQTALAEAVAGSLSRDLKIYNEYGPTEATVGCIVHLFDRDRDRGASVPIGRPFAGTRVYLLDEYLHPVPPGVAGELHLAGPGLADGYWNMPDLSAQRFIPDPFVPEEKMYRTGDLARLNTDGEFEYLGRTDEQMKIGGIRIEPGEIEAALAAHPAIDGSVVVMTGADRPLPPAGAAVSCRRCGLPANYPSAGLNKEDICNFCRSFENYREKVRKYFRTPDDLQQIFDRARTEKSGGEYDCLMLLSGGKDSTYALARLVGMDLRVLAFTLDNGYISEQAKENIRRVCRELGVDHLFGQTPAMNRIFVDSLNRHKNVCNGCFKTIYTLSTKIALEKNIPFVVTGLSRGQFFETRLTEELFWQDDPEKIDQIILEARKTYHRTDDAVKKLLDTSCFRDDEVFERVRFIDFYRYVDVSFREMMRYLDEHLPWVRPTDTGRSTNCLINQVGIYVHKKKLGYSNYAFPYSWDVRMGHKTRSEALSEIDEQIDVPQVKKIMREIGYAEEEAAGKKHLVAYFVASADVSPAALREHLAARLPAYLIPARFQRLDSLPLTPNGKIDRRALPAALAGEPLPERPAYIAPETEIEKMIAGIWTEVLHTEKIGLRDNFLELGGHSLAAIRIMARINEAFRLDLPLNKIFEIPTVAGLAAYIEETIRTLLEAAEPAG